MKEELTMKKPKVSVLMSCYNHEKYVATAIESVLNQTYKDFELLVMDNGCTDKSYEIMTKYRERIRIFRLEENDIMLSNKILLENAEGEYIAYMTSDDYWMPEKLERQVEVLENNQSVAVCTTWAYVSDEELKYDETQKNRFMIPNYERPQMIKFFVENGNCIAFPSSVLRKEMFFERKKPERGYRQLDDFFLWLHILLKNAIYIVEEPLVVFRCHFSGSNQNMSAPSQENLIRHWNEMADIMVYFLEHISDELFIQSFKDSLINTEPESSIQVECEKFLWLKRRAEEEPLLETAVLNFYFRHSTEEFQVILSEQYHFSLTDFWKISGNSGLPSSYMSLQNAKIDSYRLGAKAAIDKILDLGVDEYRKVLYTFLHENKQNLLRILGKTIGDLLTKTYDEVLINQSAMYSAVVDSLTQMVKYINEVREDLSYLGIDIKEEDWNLYQELLRLGKEQHIDLYEGIIPYTEWLYKEICKAIST